MSFRHAALAAALAATSAVPAAADSAPLEQFRNRLFVTATVENQPVTALLDSGAEMSLLDDELAARLGVALAGADQVKGSGGTADIRFAEGVDIAAAGVSLPGRKVAVMDLDDVSDRLIGRKLEMILGRDIFDSARLWIDIAGGRLEALAAAGSPRGVRLPLTAEAGIESVPVTVEGVATRAHFDLGNGSDVLIGKAFADRLGLSAPGRIVERRSGGGIGGAIERDIVMLKSLRIAGRTFRNVRAAIDPTESAGNVNVGTAILRHFVITTDFPNRSVWLEPRK